jgi:light-regulated signal transduction histidine kinase (bacteriophytochrome)
LTFFVGILLAGNWLLYFSMRKSMDFFMTVREHIQHVTRTWDLDQQIEVATTDEIGELAQDINLMQSEIGKLKGSLLHQAEELAAANQELESFSYTLSHDLRVPLTRAYAAVQLLEEGYADRLDEDGRALLHNISKGCEGMEDLIEAILVLTNIVRKELCWETLDLAELAWDIVEELRTGDPARQVEIVIADRLTCTGDRQLLRVALRDLLENAWKYTSTTPAPRIEFGSVEQHGKPVYYFKDNGIGFDMQQAEKLFIPFKRLVNARSYPGTGIGLATVAKIMLRHGGNIWAVGQEGQGATFYFSIPQKPTS